MSRRTNIFSLLVACLPCLLMLSACAAEHFAERFLIVSAKMDGSDYKILLKDPTHNLTHPRVSPNGKHLTFTKYFHKNLNGLCLEDDGYLDTEILMADMDGKISAPIVPHKPGVMAANSSWVDDNSIIYIYCKPPDKPQIRRLEIKTGRETVLPTPSDISPSDPHIRGDDFVFGTIDFENKVPNTIWYSKTDGSNARQLSHPPAADKKPDHFNFGDYDPRISPDRSKVVFMRYSGGTYWRIFMIDLKPGAKEIEIAGGGKGAWAVADWTPDGKEIICWHIDPSDLKGSGIWLMKPDGSNKRQIDVPRKYMMHNPGTYLDPATKEIRMIYGAKFNAGL